MVGSATCRVACAGSIPVASSKDLSRDTISLVDGMTHYHSAAGSNPAPASNVEGQGTFAITPNPGTRPDQFSRQAL